MIVIGALLLCGCAKIPAVSPVPGSGSGAVLSSSGATSVGIAPAPDSPGDTLPVGADGKLDYPNVLVMALNGNHDAEFELGAMFHDGDGIDRDYVKAIEWYTKAAEAGNRQAAFNLGLMYINGEGAEKNSGTATLWLVKASSLGDVRAMFHLGQMAYLQKDFKTAYPHYLKSAMGGFADAQMNAGVMHIRGEGVPAPDMIEGYAWLKIAGDSGNERAAGLFMALNEQISEEQKTKGEARAGVLRKEVIKQMGRNIVQ